MLRQSTIRSITRRNKLQTSYKEAAMSPALKELLDSLELPYITRRKGDGLWIEVIGESEHIILIQLKGEIYDRNYVN